jgi:hypothetical protein
VIENALCLHASLPAVQAHRYRSSALPLPGDQQIRRIHNFYSSRSVFAGSILATRSAGNVIATDATIASVTNTRTIVGKSYTSKPKRRFRIASCFCCLRSKTHGLAGADGGFALLLSSGIVSEALAVPISPVTLSRTPSRKR